MNSAFLVCDMVSILARPETYARSDMLMASSKTERMLAENSLKQVAKQKLLI